MANEQLLPWINSAGADGERNSMVSFPCDGNRTAFEFNFAGGYIDRANIKAYTYEEATGLTNPIALTPSNFLGPNTLSITPAIQAGFYLVVYRDTQKTVPLVNYATGAVMDEKNLDMGNQQAVFVAAEMVDRFDAINASSADAIVRSVEAVRKADEALAASGQASTDSASALAASGQAVTTANAAKATADGIDGKATQAMADGAAAVLTANAAKSASDAATATANGIDGKAQQALDNSVGATNIAQAANTTANSAAATANGIDAKAQTALDTLTAVFTSSRYVSRLRGGNTGRWVTDSTRRFKFEWDWAVVGRSGANAPVAVPAGSVTVDLSTTGAGGWDVTPTGASGVGFFYLIAKADGTSSIVVSRSASAPALPSGYVAAMFVFLCTLATGTTYPAIQYAGELYGRKFAYTNMLTVVNATVAVGSSLWTTFPLYGQALVEAHVGYARLYITVPAYSAGRVVVNLGYATGIGSYVAVMDATAYAPYSTSADNYTYTPWEIPGTCPIVLETSIAPPGGTSASSTVFVGGYRVNNNAI